MKKINKFPKHLRPREKLEASGVANLTEVELVALILGSGTKKYPVMEVASQVLKTYDRTQLRSVTLEKLQLPGLGKIQASKLIAALELGKRIMTEVERPQILCPEDVVREVDDIRGKNREYLVALYLNARHEVVHKETLTIGGLNFNSLEPRDVFAPAFLYPCLGVILIHNHPSGDASPSEDDLLMTHALQKSGELLGIHLLDHLIVTRRTWSSILAPPPDTGSDKKH